MLQLLLLATIVGTVINATSPYLLLLQRSSHKNASGDSVQLLMHAQQMIMISQMDESLQLDDDSEGILSLLQIVETLTEIDEMQSFESSLPWSIAHNDLYDTDLVVQQFGATLSEFLENARSRMVGDKADDGSLSRSMSSLNLYIQLPNPLKKENVATTIIFFPFVSVMNMAQQHPNQFRILWKQLPPFARMERMCIGSGDTSTFSMINSSYVLIDMTKWCQSNNSERSSAESAFLSAGIDVDTLCRAIGFDVKRIHDGSVDAFDDLLSTFLQTASSFLSLSTHEPESVLSMTNESSVLSYLAKWCQSLANNTEMSFVESEFISGGIDVVALCRAIDYFANVTHQIIAIRDTHDSGIVDETSDGRLFSDDTYDGNGTKIQSEIGVASNISVVFDVTDTAQLETFESDGLHNQVVNDDDAGTEPSVNMDATKTQLVAHMIHDYTHIPTTVTISFVVVLSICVFVVTFVGCMAVVVYQIWKCYLSNTEWRDVVTNFGNVVVLEDAKSSTVPFCI